MSWQLVVAWVIVAAAALGAIGIMLTSPVGQLTVLIVGITVAIIWAFFEIIRHSEDSSNDWGF